MKYFDPPNFVPTGTNILIYIYPRGVHIKGPFKLRSGWRDTTLAGFLFVEGTGMREQGSLKGEGTDGEICASSFLSQIWH